MSAPDKKKLQADELREHISASKRVCNIEREKLIFHRSSVGRGTFGDLQCASYQGISVVVKNFRSYEKLSNYRDLIGLDNCKCPNIATLIGAGPDLIKENLEYIVMEYAENLCLQALMDDRNIEYGSSHLFLWTAQGANAVDYMHKFSTKSMLHRDIKPSNMLLFDYCRILKLSDFGTATSEREGPTYDQGTVYYIAPEVKRANHRKKSTFSDQDLPRNYGTKVDIYSFCASIYGVVTRRAFNGESTPIDGCPPCLRELLGNGLSIEPSKRPSAANIADFADFVVNHISTLRPSECKIDFFKEWNLVDYDTKNIDGKFDTPEIRIESASPLPPTESENCLKDLKHQFRVKLESFLSQCKLRRHKQRMRYRMRVMRFCEIFADYHLVLFDIREHI